MLPGEFLRKLQKLNKNLKVWVQDDSRQSAGLFYVVRGEYEPICGVDKNFVPEHIKYKEDGAILKSGWRRVLKILINQGFVNRKQAEKLFETRLSYRAPSRPKIYQPTKESIQAKWR